MPPHARPRWRRAATALALAGALAALALDPLRAAPRPAAAQAPPAFLETFDGSPAAPRAWADAGHWDVTINDTGRAVNHRHGMEAMQGGHGPDCSSPGEQNTNGHPVRLWSEALYLCHDHVMTAVDTGGYSALWLTPPALLDLSGGEAVLRWDMSTFRSSARDWIEVFVVPWADDVQTLNDGQTTFPAHAIRLEMRNVPGHTDFNIYQVRPEGDVLLSDPFGPVYEDVLTESAVRRDTFELRLAPDHIKFGLPAYNLWFTDRALAGLGWTRGLVHLGHYSYNPDKDGSGYCARLPGGLCGADTWHWDNVAIAPAAPFALNASDHEYLEAGTDQTTFTAPAPAGASARFVGYGAQLQVSYDGGATWHAPARNPRSPAPNNDYVATAYVDPIPAGATTARFRDPQFSPWFVHGVSVFGLGAPPPPPPTPAPPTPTSVAAATPTPLPTATPTATPVPATATPAATATPPATATPVPSATATAAPSVTATATAPAPAFTTWADVSGAHVGVSVVASQAGTYLVDIELDPAGSSSAVKQWTFDQQSFAAGQKQAYGVEVPSGLPAGQYTVKIGVFTAGGGTLLSWNNGAATVTVPSEDRGL